MRLLGLGVLVLLLIGTLVVLGQRGTFDGAWQRATGNEAERFDDQDIGASANFDIDGTDVFATPASSDAPTILSGLPSYANLAFRMPRDERPVSGVFELAFTSNVAQGVEGALRVSINGAKRADYLLREGSSSGRLEVELTAQDLSSSSLDIGVSLQGRGPIAECSSDDSIAAVVAIEPATGLRLTLTGAPTSVGDRLALWGGRVPVEWSDNIETGSRGHRIYQAALLFEKGYRPLFDKEGLSGDTLTQFARNAPVNRRHAYPASYPVSLTGDPANRGARKFSRRVNWRYTYRANDLPDETLPSALDLRLLIGPEASDMQRDVTVTLNERMLYSRRLAGDSERLNQSIAIPAGTHSWDNTIDVTVSSSQAAEMRCGDIGQSTAELLPETVLRPGPKGDTGPLAALRGGLRNAGRVALQADTLTQADAEAGARLLSRLAPRQWQLADRGGAATVRILSGAAAAALPRDAQGPRQWLIYREPGDNGNFVARRADAQHDAQPPAVTLLVSLPATAAEPQAARTAP